MIKKILQTHLLVLFALIFSAVYSNVFGQTVWDGTSTDIEWYNSTDIEFEISTAEELAGLAQLVNEGTNFSGKIIKLASNIWLNENGSTVNNWTPIGESTTSGESLNANDKRFEGIFDGGNNIIYNLYCYYESTSKIGLFGTVQGNNTIIKNTFLVNPTIKAMLQAGSLIGFIPGGNTVTIENCMALNAHVELLSTTVGNNAGTLIGNRPSGSGKAKVNNCMATGYVKGGWVGGLCGAMQQVDFSNCYFNGEVEQVSTSNSGSGTLGAICNYTSGNTVTNCYSYLLRTGSTSTAGGMNGTSKTIEEMQDPSFLELLNANGIFYQADCSVNNGVPILADYLCNIKIEGPKEVCAGSIITLTAYNGFDTYVWKKDNIVIQGETGASIQVTVNSTSTYSATSTRTEDNLVLEGELTVTVLENFTFTTTVALSYDNQTHGTISPSIASIDCTEPQPIIYTITPNSGWYITRIIVDGTEIEDFAADANGVVTGTYNPTAGQHGNVTVHFFDEYTITASMKLNNVDFFNPGLINGWTNQATSQEFTVKSGSNYTFVVNETNRFTIEKIVVNDEDMGTDPSSILTNITEDQNVEFHFDYDGTFKTWDGSIDITWFNDTETSFELYTPEQLAGVAWLVNENITEFSEKTIKLMANIWLNENESTTNNWTPIGGSPTATGETSGTIRIFKGNLNGNNNTIYNMYIDKTGYYQAGLFAAVYNSNIENLTIINPYVKSKGMMGAIIGFVRTGGSTTVDVKNCMVINATLEAPVVSGNNNIGGIVGAGYNTNRAINITNCVVTGDFSGNYIGGIAGNGSNTVLTNCYFSGTINSHNEKGGLTASGGSATNCYSNLEKGNGSATPTVKTIDEMKEESFVSNLGASYKTDCNINEGLPILTLYPCNIEISGENEICANTEITLTALNGLDTYTWNTGSNENNITVTPTETTTYTITSTRIYDNVVLTGSITVEVKDNMTFTGILNSENGIISPATAPISCSDPQPIEYTVTPNEGWFVSKIEEDGEEIDVPGTTAPVINSYTPKGINGEVVAYFSNQFNVIASMSLDGEDFFNPGLIEPWGTDGTITVDPNGNLTFSLIETNSFKITDVKVNGESIGTQTSYTFENISANNQTIHVEYEHDITSKIWDGTVDITWYDADETDFIIYNAEQLAGLAYIANLDNANNFSGKNFKLMNDIWLNDDNSNENIWTPIACDASATGEESGSKSFQGNFNGNYHLIHNLYVNRGNNYQAGLFASTSGNITIENFGLINPVVIGRGMVGAIMGMNRSGGNVSIKNCMVINVTIEGGTGDNGITAGNNLGGIIGSNHPNSSRCSIENCSVTGKVTGRYPGGLIGNARRTTFTNCYFSGETTRIGGDAYKGGIAANYETANSEADNIYSNITEKDGTGNNGTYRTNTEMQEETFVNDLNNGGIYFIADCGINNGLPIMQWYVCIEGPAESCSGQEISLSLVNEYDSYLWSTGDTEPQILVSPTENNRYEVTVTSGDNTMIGYHNVVVYDQLNISAEISPYENGIIYGTVDPVTTNASCDYTDEVEITITPDEGWHVSAIYLNGLVQEIPEPGANDIIVFTFTPAVVLNDVEVELLPYCERISNLIVNEIGTGSAYINWESGKIGIPTEYSVEYSVSGENDWTVKTTENLFYVISGLDPITIYDIRVKAICDTDNSIYETITITTKSEVENIEIGEGTSTNGYFPVYNYYRYSATQQIYLASEVDGKNVITGIKFYLDANTITTKDDVKIYLGHTTKETFSNTSDGIPFDEMQEVYSGNLNCITGWNHFEFDNIFRYDGINNLVIAVLDNSSTNSYASRNFRTHNAGATRSLRYSSSGTAYSSTYSATADVRNNIQLDIATTTECARPDLFVTEISSTTGTVNFVNNSAGIIELKYKKAADTEWIPVTLEANETEKTFVGLDPETTYEVRIKANCGVDNLSDSITKTLTTYEICAEPVINDPITVTTTTATITWAGLNASSWDVEYKEAGDEDWISAGTVTQASIELDELTHNTTYDLRIKATCTNTLSNWVEGTFTTYEECDLPEDVEINRDLTLLVTTITWTDGNANSWDFEYKLTSEENWTSENVTVAEATINIVAEEFYEFRVKANCTNTISEWVNSTFNTFECDIPENIDITAGTITANVEWTSGDAESWNVEYKKVSETDWTTAGNVTTPEITLTDLTDNTDYEIRVKAICTNAESPWTNGTFTTLEICNVPSDINALAATTSATITWEANGADEWNVEYKKVSETDWTDAGTVTTATKTIENLTQNTDYEVRIKVVCNNPENDWVTGTFTTLEICSDPSNLNITANITSATVTWNGNNADEWNVEYKKVSETDWTSKGSVTIATITLDDLGENTDYQVRVKVVCNNPINDWVTGTFTTLEDCNDPTNITATEEKSTSATITWTANGGTSWNVEYKKTVETDWTAEGMVNATTITLNDLDDNTDYDIRIKVVCNNPINDWVTGTFTTLEICNDPTNISVNASTTSAIVTWNGNNADEWYVEYKKASDTDWTDASTVTTATKTIEDLTQNTDYEVRIKVVCNNPENDWITGTFTTLEICNDPSNINITANTTSATITWNDNDADEWYVEYKKDSDTDWTEAGTVTQPTKIIDNLTANTDYEVRIKVVCNNPLNDWVNETFKTLDGCDNPTNINVDVTATTAKVTWTAGNASGWDVEYKKNSETDWTDGGSVTVAEVSLANLSPDTDYTVRIKSTCTDSEGTWVSETFKTDDESVACDKPISLNAVVTELSVTITWESGNADNWAVEYKVNDASITDWTNAGTKTTATATIDNLTAKTKYIARVKAVCGDDSSEWAEITFETGNVGIGKVDSDMLKVYPNPAKDFVEITTGDSSDINGINIYDSNGRLVREINQTGSHHRINIENLLEGNYMLHIRTNEGIIIKKIIKN